MSENRNNLSDDIFSCNCKFWNINFWVLVEREFNFIISRKKRRRIVEARSEEEISRAEYNE